MHTPSQYLVTTILSNIWECSSRGTPKFWSQSFKYFDALIWSYEEELDSIEWRFGISGITQRKENHRK